MKSNKIRVFDAATAIVTGGASGIGRGLCEKLAARGCEVVIADLQSELAEEVALRIQAADGKARAVKLDVTNFSAMEQVVQETVKRTGRLDYMFNNAGISIGGNVNDYRIEDWNYIIDINLRGVINGVQAAYKVMMDQGFGHIVNTASIAGLIPSSAVVSYATTKHAVVGLSKSLRAEAVSHGIRVSVFCPGFIRTAILDGGGKFGKMVTDISSDQQHIMLEMFKKTRPMSPQIFAEKALNLVARNKAIIILPSWYRLLWWLNRLSPSLGISFAQKNFQNMQRKLDIG